MEEEIDNAWMNIGTLIEDITLFEKIVSSYDQRGVRVFCKDKNGNVLEITGHQDSPVLPQVKLVEWKDIGQPSEKGIDITESIVTFTNRKPEIIDIDQMVVK
jgi:hypothetical protein